MPTDLVNILGAGGHGRVVIDALLSCGWPAAQIRIRDDRLELHGRTMLDCAIEAPVLPAVRLAGKVHAAVGAANVRRDLLDKSGLGRSDWLTVVHPRAAIAASAVVGPGSFVAAQAVVGPCVRIGIGAIINHGSVVDHDCKLGDFCHVAPLASLGGGVCVGHGVLIGTGARVLPGLLIGDGAVIGAGAVVVASVPSGQTWLGVPAHNYLKES